MATHPLQTALAAIRPSIFQIGTGVAADAGPLGTGFFIDRSGYAVTANHVVTMAEQLLGQSGGPIQLSAGLAHENTENMRANFTVIGLSVAARDTAHDLAILSANPNPFQSHVATGIVLNGEEVALPVETATLDHDRPNDGEPIAVSGYPLNNPTLITNSGTLASVWAVHTQEIQPPGAPPGITIPEMQDVYLADVQVNPGNSGGPVYRASDATVVGVCIANQPSPVMDSDMNSTDLYYGSGIAVVTPAKYVGALLRVALSEGAAAEDSTAGSDSPG